MGSETINKKTQEILNDLSLLRKKHIHELDRSPGHAKCSTLADRMEENLECIISSFEEMLALKETAAEREKFDLLSGLLDGLAKEVSDLTKKQPDGLVNSFKVGQINRVLQPLKNLMISEPSNSFLDLVAEVEERADKSRNSYSDVAVILSQYKEACIKYREKYYSADFF